MNLLLEQIEGALADAVGLDLLALQQGIGNLLHQSLSGNSNLGGSFPTTPPPAAPEQPQADDHPVSDALTPPDRLEASEDCPRALVHTPEASLPPPQTFTEGENDTQEGEISQESLTAYLHEMLGVHPTDLLGELHMTTIQALPAINDLLSHLPESPQQDVFSIVPLEDPSQHPDPRWLAVISNGYLERTQQALGLDIPTDVEPG